MSCSCNTEALRVVLLRCCQVWEREIDVTKTNMAIPHQLKKLCFVHSLASHAFFCFLYRLETRQLPRGRNISSTCPFCQKMLSKKRQPRRATQRDSPHCLCSLKCVSCACVLNKGHIVMWLVVQMAPDLSTADLDCVLDVILSLQRDDIKISADSVSDNSGSSNLIDGIVVDDSSPPAAGTSSSGD